MSFRTIKKMMLLLIATSALNAQDFTLSLKKTINIAKHNDLWLVESYYAQKAIESMSIAEGSLPDPKVSLNFLNYPVDSFDFGQEPMTQVKVGVSQVFPRGNTRKLKQKQLFIKSQVHPFQRLDRLAKVEMMVSQLWFDAFKSQKSISFIEQKRALFEQLVEVAESNYSAAFGNAQQQDIIRAQLELTRLDDRLMVLNQNYDKYRSELSLWLTDRFTQDYKNLDVVEGINNSENWTVDSQFPKQTIKYSIELSDNDLLMIFNDHPAVVAIQQTVKVSETGIAIAKQKYKPAWGINASYGYRGDASEGINRSDFLTIGVSLDVPLFTKNRQDKQLESAVAFNDASQSKVYHLLKQMLASYKSSLAQLKQLNKRQSLYKDKLLPQMHDQAEASLTAYTHDNGEFSEVVRSRIAELNAEIDALNIAVERQKVMTQINYFFTKV
ncbi:MAG: TolC family protein [Marinicellaceae bacterium]